MNRTILIQDVQLRLISDISRASTTSIGVFLPIDAGDDMIHSEGRLVVIVLPPDLTSWPDAIVGAVERVVERDDDGEQPGNGGQDLVRDDRVLGVGFALGEGIDYRRAQERLARSPNRFCSQIIDLGDMGNRTDRRIERHTLVCTLHCVVQR